MEQILAEVNQAQEKLIVLNAIQEEKFKVITVDNIDDYIHHYEQIVLVQMRINAALLSYMRINSK